MLTLSLDGPWQFRLAGAPKGDVPRPPALTRWLPARAPGTVHYLLYEHGLIPDPFDARNELDLQWIDQQDWEWSRTFEVDEPATQRSRQDLIFDGLDTVATI